MSMSIRLLCAVALVSMLPLDAGASGATSEQGVTQERLNQRDRYRQAEAAWSRRQTTRYQTLKSSLVDYPLYPYLEYRELRQTLGRASNKRVDRFLQQYGTTPLAPKLRRAWLARLAEEGRWEEYLRYYIPDSNVSRQCNRLYAMIRTGRQQEALRQVEPIWLSGKSQPKECDPVFASWRAAGYLTQDLVWDRIALAIGAGQPKLARYLRRFLPPGESAWVDRWLALRSAPQSALDTEFPSSDHPQLRSMLLDAVARLARKDPDQALQLWGQLSERYRFSDREQAAAQRAVALRLARTDSPQALAFLDAIVPGDEDLRLHEARIGAALAAGDWELLLTWIESLPPSELESERWRYWRARSLEQLGHALEAEAILTALAAERSYYGFLAADRVGLAYNLEHAPVAVGKVEVARVAALPAAQRAAELRALQRSAEARLEWVYLLRALDGREQLLAAAKLASNWGWHDRAIVTLARTQYWSDLEMRFPLEHRKDIERRAGQLELESSWVFAVVRQESAFAEDARSHAGALGLMQLMPATARFIAKKTGSPAPKKSELLTANTNIRLGTAYLNRIYEDLYQHQILATAAYNAGPHRVRKWLPRQSMPADVWIETIPFKETRKYVKRVLAYQIIYEQRLGLRPSSISQRMVPVGPDAVLAAELAAAAGKG